MGMISTAFLLANLAFLPTDSLMSPGVSHELARYRAAHIRGVRYDLHLDVTRQTTAFAKVTVTFTRVNGGDVYLDFRGSDFSDVIVNDKPTPAVEYVILPGSLRASAIRSAMLRTGTDGWTTRTCW